MSNSAVTVEIFMKPKGCYRRTTTDEYLGDLSVKLREAAQSVPASIYSVGKLADSPFQLHLQHKSTHIFAFTRLTELKLNTVWRFVGKELDRVYPCFYKTETNDFGATYTWPLPKSMSLWLIGMWRVPYPASVTIDPLTNKAVIPTQRLEPGYLDKAYLIALKGPSAFLRLPLCNIYEDGGICLGERVPAEIHKGTMMERMETLLLHFRNSGWNSHLHQYQSTEDTKALFQLDPKGKPLKDNPPENWERHCRKINNTNYGDLGLPELTAAGL
jgi:hypothetical protein